MVTKVIYPLEGFNQLDFTTLTLVIYSLYFPSPVEPFYYLEKCKVFLGRVTSNRLSALSSCHFALSSCLYVPSFRVFVPSSEVYAFSNCLYAFSKWVYVASSRVYVFSNCLYAFRAG